MIDWTKVLVMADDDIVGIAAGQVVLFASGVPGQAATLDVAATETLAPGEDAYVRNLGTDRNALLEFGIPRGITGNPGENASIEVDNTETLEPGLNAYVQNVGTAQHARLQFGIPRGASGVWGDIIGDLDDQSDLLNALNSKATPEDLAKEILYFSAQTVGAANNAEIFRITDDAISTDTVVLGCVFADPAYITSDVSWESFVGYIIFTGTCTAVTTADVTLGRKGN